MACLENDLIDKGFFPCSISKNGSELYFCKTLKPLITVHNFKKIERYLQIYLCSLTSFGVHREVSVNNREYVEKELRTWALWKKEGINVPKLISYDGKELIYEFIPHSSSYRSLLNIEDSFGKFDKFVELYKKIRNIAKKKNDPDLLHSDPHLGNFLYSEDTQEAIPIDSGVLLNPGMSFEDLDARLINETLISIANLETSDATIEEYFRRFKEILTAQEIEKILELNKPVPLIVDLYFKIREEFAYRIKKRDKVASLDEYKLFNEKCGEFLKDIFLE